MPANGRRRTGTNTSVSAVSCRVSRHGALLSDILTAYAHTCAVSGIQSIILAKALFCNIRNNEINTVRETGSPLWELGRAGGST